jgi:hypothetical protein
MMAACLCGQRSWSRLAAVSAALSSRRSYGSPTSGTRRCAPGRSTPRTRSVPPLSQQLVELSEGIPRAEEIDPYLTPDASGLSDEADQLRRGLEDAVSKVHHAFPRVLLLFGDDSWAGKWAGDVLLALRAAVREAVAWPQPAPDDALRQFERASMGQFPLHSGSAVHSRDLHLRE